MTPLSHEGALKRIKGLKSALNDLEAGLNGEPFQWGQYDGDYKQAILSKFGFRLFTKSGLEDYGYILNEDATPVGSRFLGGYGRSVIDLYLLEVQTTRAKRKRETS